MRSIGRCESSLFPLNHKGRSNGIVDLLQALFIRLWNASPDNAELGQQVVLISLSLWDTPMMCSASRKMFNLLKTTVWARIAAWAEWIDVSFCAWIALYNS
jgi:hypothetical protein